MPRPSRKIAFVLTASDHGSMIVNRFDYHMVSATAGYGVGFQILENSSYDMGEVETALRLLELRRQYHGDGVVAVDCGANIGVHTVEWARHMSQWGMVLAIEAQEPIYYALAGNIALNNCFNARAMNAAVGASTGLMRIPRPDYLSPGSFGSLELRGHDKAEFIGQVIDYEGRTAEVRALTLDSLALPRVDLLKIDVEGMELDVLAGGGTLIAAQRPIMIVEYVKSDRQRLTTTLEGWGYRQFPFGLNLLAVHGDDPCGSRITIRDKS
ncbi:MAG TPA: FkbM family methyltransferase [Acetobacteraceae bacterium]